MYCYYIALKDNIEDTKKGCTNSGSTEETSNALNSSDCDQKKQIRDKTLLIPAEIEELKQQVKSDTSQEEDDHEAEEEQQTATTILEPVEPEVNPEPEDPIPLTNHETPDDDGDDYDQLKDEFLELLEEVKSQPMKERKKLSKLKNDKKLKRVVKILGKIIEETSTDYMNLTTINQMQYTAALLITNRITQPKLATNRKPRSRPPA